MEHRWGIRHAMRLTVSFGRHFGTPGVGWLLNISTSGAYLQTMAPLRVLTLIDLTLSEDVVPGGPSFTACVVRRDRNGAGLEWQEPIRLRPGRAYVPQA
jgi:hypothetical protein